MGNSLASKCIEFNPIGVFRCREESPQEVPRQAALGEGNLGEVVLTAGCNYDQALQDLDGFERIWLVFAFDRNADWRPLTKPPRGSRKVGVFACRSPYRPNGIGISCVELLAVDGLRVVVRDHDLLDGTPILDIKPYIPYCDSFPDVATGWLAECRETGYSAADLAKAEDRYKDKQLHRQFITTWDAGSQ